MESVANSDPSSYVLNFLKSLQQAFEEADKRMLLQSSLDSIIESVWLRSREVATWAHSPQLEHN